MKSKIVFIILISITFFIFFNKNKNNSSIKSSNDLINALKVACSNGDFEAIKKLYYWDDIDSEMRSMSEYTIKDVLLKGVHKSYSLEPLDPNLKMVNILKGFKYYPNVELKGFIKIDSETKEKDSSGSPRGTSSTKIPYGVKGSSFYLANTIKEKVEGDYAVQKQYSIMIWGFGNSESPLQFEGTVKYLNNKKEETKSLTGKGSLTRSFYADSIISANVHKIIEGGDIELTITEEGKEIYKSSKIKTNDPIIFTNKIK